MKNESSNENKKEYKFLYVGETWRSGYERAKEHLEDLSRLDEKSHLLKHCIDKHPGEKLENVKFGFRVKKKFNTALERQVGEAVAILLKKEKGTSLINSKSEFSRCTLPRLTIDNKDKKD